jgi:hypothetical protein
MGSFSLLFSGLRKETIKPTGFLLSWIRHLVFMFVLTWLIVLGLQAFLPEPLLEEKLDDAVTYFLIALIIFTIGYRSLSQPEIIAERAGKEKKYEKTGLSPQKGKSIKQQLLKLMEEKRPFLDPGLTLFQVHSHIRARQTMLQVIDISY